MMQKSFKISLTEAEVVVLDSCIDKVLKHADEVGLIDAAERQAFWNFHGLLEKVDSVAFAHDYDLQLNELKKLLRPEET